MKKLFVVLSLLFVIPGFWAQKANAGVLMPDVDGTIFSFGYINADETVQAAEDLSRGIIEFDVSGVSSPVTASFLRLYRNASEGPFPFQVDVFSYPGDGTLTVADYNAGSLVSSFSYNNEAAVDIDLTAAARQAVSDSYDYLGLNLRMSLPYPEGEALSYISFGSLEYPLAGALPAELHVATSDNPTVPEPATILLLSFGLAGRFLRKRQQL